MNRYHLYQVRTCKGLQWRWSCVNAGNYKKQANGNETFFNYGDCSSNLHSVCNLNAGDPRVFSKKIGEKTYSPVLAE